MYITEITFECFDNTTFEAVDKAINGLLEAWRYNGQILGREFPLLFLDGAFQVRLVCPEKDSLHPKYHSLEVKQALAKLADAFLTAPKIKLLGQDINSEASSPTLAKNWQILYTTYVHTCSPLRCGDTFMPIPLYKIPAVFNGNQKAIIKWQTQWQACDEIQMAGTFKAELAALAEIQDVKAGLFRTGWDLRGQIECLTQMPTYYYQYHLGEKDIESAKARRCPMCKGDWRLTEPLHEFIYFKCDDCRLVSNLAWDLQ